MLPPSVATSNFLYLGAIGSGKTTSILLLMQSVLPLIGEGLNRRALIYDAKSEIISYVDGLVPRWHTFNPFDARCVAWDMAKDIDDPASALELAEILIPTTGNETNPFFPKAARHIVYGVVLAFIQLAPGKWKFGDVVNALKSAESIKDVLRRTDATSDIEGLYFANERTSNDIVATVATAMLPFQIIAANWKHAEDERPPVSLNDWIQGEYVLILGASERSRVAVDALNQLIFTRAAQLLLDLPERDQNRPERNQSWLFLDEVRHAGKLLKLHAVMTKGRSRGICTVLGLQDIDGLRALYDKEIADEIAGQCANKALLRINSPATAKWASELWGEFEDIYTTHGTSYQSGINSSYGTSTNQQLMKREAVLPSEFMTLPQTGPANGLTGYYLTSERALPKTTIPWNLIEQALPDRTKVENYVPRPSAHQYLVAWKLEDKVRLGIDKPLQQEEKRKQYEQAQGALPSPAPSNDSEEYGSPAFLARIAAKYQKPVTKIGDIDL